MFQKQDIQVVSEEIFKHSSKMPSAKTFEIEIKASRLAKSAVIDFRYNTYLSESIGKIISMNGRPGGKFYKNNAYASSEEYERVIQYCEMIQKEWEKKEEAKETKSEKTNKSSKEAE